MWSRVHSFVGGAYVDGGLLAGGAPFTGVVGGDAGTRTGRSGGGAGFCCLRSAVGLEDLFFRLVLPGVEANLHGPSMVSALDTSASSGKSNALDGDALWVGIVIYREIFAERVGNMSVTGRMLGGRHGASCS